MKTFVTCLAKVFGAYRGAWLGARSGERARSRIEPQAVGQSGECPRHDAARGGRPGAQPGVELHVPPPGLRPDEEQWLLARAAQAGWLTAAWCGLVELVILYEACAVLVAHCEDIRRHGRRAGRSSADIEHAVAAWSRQRAALRVRARLMNMLHGTRPGWPGGYGRLRLDDPAKPLPRDVCQQLIAEGRTYIASRVTGTAVRRAMPGVARHAGRTPALRGLSPEKRRWLRQRSALVGGLDAALRFLLRAAMRCVAASEAWRARVQATRCIRDDRPHAVYVPLRGRRAPGDLHVKRSQ